MQKPLRWFDAITINIYFFALTLRNQTLTPLILPLLVQQFMGDELKGTSYGRIRLVSLMVALLAQAIAGMLSDRSTSRLGKRRPYILLGTVLEVLAFALIGVIASTLSGTAGYNALFGLVIFSMIASNTAQGAAQGLIPDLVPPDQRGRYSAIKALFEVPLPLILVSFVISRLVGVGNLWGAIFTVIGVLVVCTILVIFVPERAQKEVPFPMNWGEVGKLAGMTAAFTLVIVAAGSGVRALVPKLIALPSPKGQLLTGLVGVAGMLLAVTVGVIASLRISLGNEARQKPAFTWWVINRLAFMVGATNLASFLLYFLQERFPYLIGASAAQPASLLVMVVGLAILVITLPAGWLTDKFGTKPIIAASGVLATLGTAIVVMAQSMALIYLGGVLVGVGVGMFYSSNWALGTRLVPQEQAGRYLGISNLAGAGAGAIGAYIGGPIGDGAGYTLLMGTYGFLFLFSIFALSGIKPDGEFTQSNQA